jgi:hypothetical protein
MEHSVQHSRANLSKASSEILWGLLDYAASSSDAIVVSSHNPVNASIDTQFLSPLASNDNHTPVLRDTANDNSMAAFDQDLDWESLGFSNEPGILFPVDLWMNGQL